MKYEGLSQDYAFIHSIATNHGEKLGAACGILGVYNVSTFYASKYTEDTPGNLITTGYPLKFEGL